MKVRLNIEQSTLDLAILDLTREARLALAQGNNLPIKSRLDAIEDLIISKKDVEDKKPAKDAGKIEDGTIAEDMNDASCHN